MVKRRRIVVIGALVLLYLPCVGTSFYISTAFDDITGYETLIKYLLIANRIILLSTDIYMLSSFLMLFIFFAALKRKTLIHKKLT